MILKQYKIALLYLDLSSSSNLPHFYLEWKKSNQNGMINKRNRKKSNQNWTIYEWYSGGMIFIIAHACTAIKLNEKKVRKSLIFDISRQKKAIFFKTFHLTFELLRNVIENVLPRWELENVLKFWKFHNEQTFFSNWTALKLAT
jgi:hypothetical protein